MGTAGLEYGQLGDKQIHRPGQGEGDDPLGPTPVAISRRASRFARRLSSA